MIETITIAAGMAVFFYVLFKELAFAASRRAPRDLL